MALPAGRLPENVPGEFFVDDTCIDCDLCRQIAPRTFGRSGRGLSFVHRQPLGEAEPLRAAMALVTCPTASIGTVHRLDARPAAARFPESVADEVYFCGFAAASSYGASSYLIQRPRGNVLVDSPRAAGPLLRRLTERGGVATLFLTHRDDVADHRRFRERFGCARVIHAADAVGELGEVERRLEGGDPVPLDDELLAIPVPGHTRGSTALLYREKYLFTGDHLWWSEEDDGLDASREVCWYSWPEQIRSLERLLDFRFEWVLPGHGRRHRSLSPEAMKAELEALLRRLGRGQ